MATGWQSLGEVLGGGPDPLAYEEGRLRTAQTEGALLAARERQLKNMATEAQAREQSHLDESLAELGVQKPDAVGNIIRSGYAQDYSQVTTGLGNQQEMRFRDTLADPNAPLGDQFAAGQGVQGKVLPRYNVSGGVSEDLLNRGAPLAPTPVGEAQIGADRSLEHLRTVQAGDPDYTTVGGGGANAPGPMGLKAPTNFMPNPAFNPKAPASTDNPPFVPIPGSPADPNVGPALGSRERAVIGRVMTAGANTAADLKTWADLPSGASQGTFGIGSNPGTKIMEATASSLKLALAPEEIRFYNATLGGFSRQMNTLEGMGLAGTQGQAAQFDSLAFRDHDTVLDKMFKMATVRQSVENAASTILSLNKNLPDDAKAALQQMVTAVQASVPYDRSDVVALLEVQRKNKRATLNDVIQQRRMGAPVRQTAPAAPTAPVNGAPVVTHTEQEYNALPRGALYLMPGETLPRRKQ